MSIDRLIGDTDVFHSSDWTQPPTKAFKVTTIHDLAPIKFEKETDPKIVEVHKRRLYWVRKEVDRVIVPTNFIKNQLEEIGINSENLRVVPEGKDEIFTPRERGEIDRVKQEYRISGEYLFAIGTTKRKNNDRLIRAFEKIRADRNLTLVIAGKINENTQQIRGVKYIGYVPDKVLPVLYSGSEALVYPTLYEGFGLPVIQAMACGVPVVTSKASSMEEVADGSAILVDPYDIDSITNGITYALKNKQSYRAKGLKRAKYFSWKKTAEETLKVYTEAC
jgi:glycosyltransferase involved in cell wall biosynthesis